MQTVSEIRCYIGRCSTGLSSCAKGQSGKLSRLPYLTQVVLQLPGMIETLVQTELTDQNISLVDEIYLKDMKVKKFRLSSSTEL